MKSMNEKINNLTRVVDGKKVKPVADMPVEMANAVEKSIERDKEIDELKKEQQKALGVKEGEAFLGAEKQPVPKAPIIPKFALDESLFEESEEPTLGEIVDKKLEAEKTNESVSEAVDTDMWDRIYDEIDGGLKYSDLSAPRQVPAKKGERYSTYSINTTSDGDIEITGSSEDSFEFAKKVANHYKVPFDIRQNNFAKSDDNKFIGRFKIPKVGESLKESLKIISDISDYEPWSGAVETWKKIEDAGMIDELEASLEDAYPDGLTMAELNDMLWFDADYILDMLGLNGKSGDVTISVHNIVWDSEDPELPTETSFETTIESEDDIDAEVDNYLKDTYLDATALSWDAEIEE